MNRKISASFGELTDGVYAPIDRAWNDIGEHFWKQIDFQFWQSIGDQVRDPVSAQGELSTREQLHLHLTNL